jgi:hypothetical protein
MKKLHFKEIFILVVPAFALIIIGASLWQRDKSSVTIENITVAVEPPLNSEESGRRFYWRDEPDTKVTIWMKHHSPSIYRRLFQKPEWQLQDIYLVDAKGHRYDSRSPKSQGHHMLSSAWGQEVQDKGKGAFRLQLYFPLHHMPKSVGKIVLKAKLVADKQIVPITTIVRAR